MSEKLPELHKEMKLLIKNLSETEIGIAQVMKEAEKLGIARVEATRELNVYLGTDAEVRRRYKEEYIPQAEADYKESNFDPEEQERVNVIVKRNADFIGQMNVLHASRAQGVASAQMLRTMMDTMEEQRKRIQTLRHISQPEWTALLAAAGFSASSLKAQRTIDQAGDFGDKLHDYTLDATEQAHNMALNAKGRGTVNHEKLLEGLTRMQNLIEKQHEEQVKVLNNLESMSEKLKTGTDLLLDAADKNKRAKLLEATQREEDAGDNKKSKASNDNKAGTPEPSAKTGTDGPKL
jgi:hypothetical protein